MSFDHALRSIPHDWSFTHLMALSPSGYQCNLLNQEDRVVVIGTGDEPESAMAAAIANTYDAKNFLHMYVPSDHASFEGPLHTSIDIAKLFLKREPINRRL